jgi:CRISPR-associated endonuclease/helicase Cas3
MPEFYAHTLEGEPPEKWQGLEEHLLGVAKLAACYAARFDPSDLPYWVGLWHDLGKFNPAFQHYLLTVGQGGSAPKAPHAIWGAVLARLILSRTKGPWEEIAIPIAGHHAGLMDAGYLLDRVKEEAQSERGKELLPLLKDAAASLPMPAVRFTPKAGTQRELFIRMVFSALVDADYDNTERHFDRERASMRTGGPSLEALWNNFQDKHAEMQKASADTPVNRIRREVYESCIRAAEGPQGVYRLTVPTGGGKTLSGLAFALRHALTIKPNLERIIVAIPYTSIIDQTAKRYREVLGDEAVLEHHSNVAWKEDDEGGETTSRLQLATENWNVPLIVTTNVQLFESLFSNRSGPCRRLHNLARSVILLDEVQTLPVGLLEPTLDVLRTLVQEYGVTVVLSTATQPAFGGESPYLEGFKGLELHEIVPAPERVFAAPALDRVDYVSPPEVMEWAQLAREIRSERQAMVVFNTRADALKLLELMTDKPEGLYHLSSLLCSEHRRTILRQIELGLKHNDPVRLISTQVVECGVDLDFPVVYRAVGPLDRIVQVAGRCNREGSLAQEGKKGKVIIFETPEGHAPKGPYRVGIGKARSLLTRYGPEKLKDPNLYTLYFHLLYQDVPLDASGIQERRRLLDYPKVAELYRLISEDTVAVVVPYGKATELVKEWQRRGPSRALWRKLQGYVVNLYRRDAERLERDGWLTKTEWGLYWWEGRYDERRGIDYIAPVHDPSDLVQ